MYQSLKSTIFLILGVSKKANGPAQPNQAAARENLLYLLEENHRPLAWPGDLSPIEYLFGSVKN
jgi:hypothetical protein